MPLIVNADVGKLSGLAPRACELCHRKDGVLRCSACQAVYYCGPDCQAEDRADHKAPCKVIKKARLRFEFEEKKLRDTPGDLHTENIFKDHVGYFWGILETRPYMRARYELVDVMLLSYGTAGGPVDVVQMALDHLLDMMRLCRGDNMGVRQLIPALYIRLGRDQDAYDFMKWYATTGEEPQYDRGDMDQPFLDVKDADALEAPAKRWTKTTFLDLSHAVALVLIKIRVLLDLQAIQNARIALRGAIPQEIIEIIRGQLVSCIVGSRHDILLARPEETAQLAETIKSQIREVYGAIETYNSHFWELLVKDPDAGVLQRPNGPYTHRSKEEALLVIGYSYASWYETPGAVDVLRSLSKVG
ncbi:zinc finger domain-containing protein [Pochonia chlamydosporia 170]|uniref:Zinc finger domain-containing protein n=1 Tax=Pochonia chlamydosporia 170 TaxID=1380566 RepID=A0A179EYY2_METCM|nr:zinc finger domain-containing protein [Pochonia chlamydosporia 170]OAQ58396.1 zinc finger domain-containing protein [Pochonia chlamydosporia 170]